MGSFGEKLRREREMRAITLDEIAEATKIGTRSLKALEDEQFEILPGGIFNKGFVRSYAKYLGLNEEQAVADYLNAIGEQPAAAEPKIEEIAAQAEAARNHEALKGLKEKGSGGAWVAFVLLIILLAGGGAGWKYYQNRVQQKEAAARAEAQAKVEAEAKAQAEREAAAKAAADQLAAFNAAQSAPNVPVQPAANATPTAPKVPIELQIKATKATWLSIKTDDQPASTETLKNSDQKIVEAQQRVVITTGNALDITCNGKPLGVLGADNKRNVFRFTPECVVQ